MSQPAAMILSASLMLRHLGLDVRRHWSAPLTVQHHANVIGNAVSKVIEGGRVRTPDMGGSSHTTDVTKAVIDAL